MRTLVHSILASALLVVSSCYGPKPATDGGGSENFYRYKWVLETLDGTAISSTMVSNEPHLLFAPGQVSRVSGSTGCNRLNGTIELSGSNGIRFSPLGTTKIMCAHGVDIEAKFLDALAKTNAYQFNDGKLLLLTDSRQLATLRSVKVQSTP